MEHGDLGLKQAENAAKGILFENSNALYRLNASVNDTTFSSYTIPTSVARIAQPARLSRTCLMLFYDGTLIFSMFGSSGSYNPKSLSESLAAIEQDEGLQHLMGPQLVGCYINVKRSESECLLGMPEQALRLWLLERY